MVLLAACGGKVVFVGPDDSEPSEPSDPAVSDGGAFPDNGFCEILCAKDNLCTERNEEACFEWCRERQTDTGKCVAAFEPQAECDMADCSECGYSQALPICVFGCPNEPDCTVGINETTCRVTCASDFEWTCTAGLPSTCTCAFNGEILATCTYEYGPAEAGCCEGVFAATHL